MQQKPRLGLGGSKRKMRRLTALREMLEHAPDGLTPRTDSASGRQRNPATRTLSIPVPAPSSSRARATNLGGADVLHGGPTSALCRADAASRT